MRQLFAFVALVILAIMAVAGFQMALINAGEDVTVVNETFTPSADTVITLDDSNIDGAFYEESVVVYNNSSVEMTEGTDYTWFQKNGTIKPLSGGDLAPDDEGTITYSYQETTQEQRDMAQILGFLPEILGFALPLLALLAFLVFARG